MIIDFGAHIMPGLDNDCKNRVETIRRLFQAKEAGVGLIVATPLYDPDECSIEEFIEKRKASEEILDSLLCDELPEIICAAKVKYSESLITLENLNQLCFCGRNFLLSLKDVGWDDNTEAILRKLSGEHGFNAIVTDAVGLLDKYSVHMQQLGIHVLVRFDEVHHKKQIRALLPYIENGLIIALGSGSYSDSPYHRLRKTIRRMNAAFDTLMLSGKKLLESI